MSFQLSGNTRTVPLPAVLQILNLANATGMLTVRRNDVEKYVHFKAGQIVFAGSNDVQDRLGETLVRSGFLNRANLEAALDEYRKNAGLKKIGAILVERRFVSPKDLFSGLKTQVRDILYSLFLWEEADFSFTEQVQPDVIQLHINLEELIAEMIARMKNEG